MSINISSHGAVSNNLRYSSAGIGKNEKADGEDSKLKNDNIDQEINELEKQKSDIQNEIKRLSGTAKSQLENKNLISQLKSEMEMIEAQIQEKRSEKLNKSTNSSNTADQADKNKKANSNVNNNPDNEEDEKQAALNNSMVVLAQEAGKYKQVSQLNNLKKSLKNKANITRGEARLDGNRDRVGDAKKYEMAAEEDVAADKLNSKIAKNIKSINTDSKKVSHNMKKENADVTEKTDKDKAKGKYDKNADKPEEKPTIDVLA